jgi:FkbM family methyltransferase
MPLKSGWGQAVKSGLEGGTVLLEIKLAIAAVLCSAPVAWILDRLFAGTIPAFGLKIWAGTPHVTPRTRAAIFFGLYESAEIRFIKKFLRRDLDVVELGASIGVVSAVIASILDSGRRLISVEANSQLIGHVETNVRDASPGRLLTTEHGAVTYDVMDGAVVEFSIGETNISSKLGIAGNNNVMVPATRLSSLLRRHNVDRFALVCDIEGAEAGLILADGDALRHCQQIVVELHDGRHGGVEMKPPQMAEMLVSRLGFRIRAQRGPVYVFTR